MKKLGLLEGRGQKKPSEARPPGMKKIENEPAVFSSRKRFEDEERERRKKGKENILGRAHLRKKIADGICMFHFRCNGGTPHGESTWQTFNKV